MHEGTVDGRLPDLEDAVLAGLAADGEQEALATLYDRHGALCYRVAIGVTRNASLAEECVQEAFLALWRSRRYEERQGSLKAFLVALAHHKAVDAVRREEAIGRRQDTYASREHPVLDSASQPEEASWGHLRDEQVRAALAVLSPEQRHALHLAYFGGRTQREIAELTGVPLGTVKTRMFAAMRRLRTQLADLGDPAWEVAQ